MDEFTWALYSDAPDPLNRKLYRCIYRLNGRLRAVFVHVSDNLTLSNGLEGALRRECEQDARNVLEEATNATTNRA